MKQFHLIVVNSLKIWLKCCNNITIYNGFGVVIAEPFDVSHTESDLNKLVQLIKSLSGETKVVMEYTSAYYEPIANALHNQGIFVSVVNPLLIDDYGTNRVRKVKTDKKDSLKIASFAIDNGLTFVSTYLPMIFAKRLRSLTGSMFNTIKFLLCRKTILSACLIPAFQISTHYSLHLAESLTVTKNGSISCWSFLIFILFQSFPYQLLR